MNPRPLQISLVRQNLTGLHSDSLGPAGDPIALGGADGNWRRGRTEPPIIVIYAEEP